MGMPSHLLPDSPIILAMIPASIADMATADNDFFPHPEGGNINTCQDIIDYGTEYETDESYICEVNLNLWEYICCPPAINHPCLVCPNGVTVDDVFVPYPEGENICTCKDITYVASTFEAETDWCGYFESLDQFCCPKAYEDPCIICPHGTTHCDDYGPHNNFGVPPKK